MEYEKKISQLKEDIDKAKNLRIRAEARLEQLYKQKEDILQEIKALGITPEDMESEIEHMRFEIEELIKQVDEMLPKDIIKGI